MMHESFLPFSSRQQVIVEEYDDGESHFGTSFDPSIDVLSSPTEPVVFVGEWQQRCRSALAFVAKVFTVGIFLFTATTIVANLAVAVGDKLYNNVGGNYHQIDPRQEPLTLTLSLDEATAKKISSIDRFEDIWNHIDADNTINTSTNTNTNTNTYSKVMKVKWSQEQQDKDCKHCNQTDDDDDVLDRAPANSVLPKSHLGERETRWAPKLHSISRNNPIGGGLRAGNSKDSLRLQRQHRDLVGGFEHGIDYAAPYHQSRKFRTAILQMNTYLGSLFPNLLGDPIDYDSDPTDNTHLDGNKSSSPPPSDTGRVRIDVVSKTSQQQIRKVKALTTIDLPFGGRALSLFATVNSAFDDSEKLLLWSELEDVICETILDAFPGGTLTRRDCRLNHHHHHQQQQQSKQNQSKGIIIAAHYEEMVSASTAVGNDTDEHGCIVSAGYSWCQPLNQCHRPWETMCENNTDGNNQDTIIAEQLLLGNDRDEHGCDRSAGFSWCGASKSCHKAWETTCGNDDNSDGDGDDNKSPSTNGSNHQIIPQERLLTVNKRNSHRNRQRQ